MFLLILRLFEVFVPPWHKLQAGSRKVTRISIPPHPLNDLSGRNCYMDKESKQERRSRRRTIDFRQLQLPQQVRSALSTTQCCVYSWRQVTNLPAHSFLQPRCRRLKLADRVTARVWLYTPGSFAHPSCLSGEKNFHKFSLILFSLHASFPLSF